MMELRPLSAFVAVARTRSFSLAGRALHVHQSTVSRRVRQLETELGLTLLDRRNGNVSLTPAGLAFLPSAQGVLNAVSDAKKAATAIRQRPRVG